MLPYCEVLWAFLSGLVVWISRGLSWLLDNAGGFAAWWAGLSEGLKRLFLALATLLLGSGAMALGLWALHCPTWPAWTAVLFVVLTAAVSWFAAGKQHEEAKRSAAEAEAQRLAAQVLELQEKVKALDFQLAQAQRKVS